MFDLVVKYLSFLKSIPLFALIYDSILKLNTLISDPLKLAWYDEIEEEVLKWNGTSISLHKFGGTQFNYHQKELGHLHSNGILDVLFNKKIKQKLIDDGRAKEHHVFKKSGWISLYIKDRADVKNAIALLFIAYKSYKK
ncbi:luciferase domain-containing protein [Pedobacter chinensis]|nr:luciferase family protein [Pedobacter chinensis]